MVEESTRHKWVNQNADLVPYTSIFSTDDVLSLIFLLQILMMKLAVQDLSSSLLGLVKTLSGNRNGVFRAYADSQGPDQPVHLFLLIRVSAVLLILVLLTKLRCHAHF